MTYTTSHTGISKSFLTILSRQAAESADDARFVAKDQSLLMTHTLNNEFNAQPVAANNNVRMAMFGNNTTLTEAPTFNDSGVNQRMKVGEWQANNTSVCAPVQYTAPKLSSQKLMHVFTTDGAKIFSLPISKNITLRSNGQTVEHTRNLNVVYPFSPKSPS